MKLRKIILSAVALAATMSVGFAAPLSFKDVPVSHWASSAIQWGSGKGIVTGYPDKTFKPNKTVTEAEFLAMLINSFEKVKSEKNGHWANPYYHIATEKNYPTAGSTIEMIRGWEISRGRVAEIIAGANGVNYTGENAVKYLLASGLAQGKDPKKISVAGFKKDDYLTRAEAVQFIRAAMEKGLTELKERPVEPSPVTDEMMKIPATPQPVQPQPKPVEQPVSNGKVTVVPSTDILSPKDALTEPAVQSFLDSLSYVNGKVTGKIPTLPTGHVMVLRYKDASDGKYGVRANDKDLTGLKTGESFSVPVIGQGGKLIFSISKGEIVKNAVFVQVPSMKAEWGTQR